MVYDFGHAIQKLNVSMFGYPARVRPPQLGSTSGSTGDALTRDHGARAFYTA